MTTIEEPRTPLRPARNGPPPATTAPDAWVPRFGRTERFAHWWTVIMLAAALLTGLGMGDDGASGSALALHVGSVVLIFIGLAAAFIFGNRRALLNAAHRLFRFDRRDAAWVRGRVQHPFGHDPVREWGMFNTGQKLLAWAVALSVTAVIATGILSWSAGGDGGGPHGAMVAVTMVLLSAHVFMAVLNPSTRPALFGMVFGRVRRPWAAKHHGEWLKELDR